MINKAQEEYIKKLIYCDSQEEIITNLNSITETEMLYVYAYNYNWDNGFEIPRIILNNVCCDLSTALMMFYSVEGEIYLEDKNQPKENGLTEWFMFLEWLYNKIMEGSYDRGNIHFKPPLNKVQLYKLNKMLTTEEKIFTEEFGEDNLNVVF